MIKLLITLFILSLSLFGDYNKLIQLSADLPKDKIYFNEGVLVKEFDRSTLRWNFFADLNQELRQSVLSKEFKAIEKRGQEIRLKELRFKSSAWGINRFYNAIGYAQSSIPAILDFCEEWKDISPKSNMPYIVQARALYARAWEIRGGEYVDKTSVSLLKEFRNHLKKAWDAILIAEKIGPIDPELLHVKAKLAFTYRNDKKLAMNIFNECYKIEPSYYPIYFTFADFLKAQWFGSHNEVREFFDVSANITSKVDGDGIYFLLAYQHSRSSSYLYSKQGFSWKLTQKGFKDLADKYGESTHLLHRYGYLAMDAKDYKAFAYVIKKVGTQWDASKRDYFYSREWYEYHLHQAKKYL
ncbi:MAG: hypothetical protein U9O86_08855 [Campylobacterota bacterium]|nr:hypothetical protein [Campylobacterota bacterium]